MMIRVSRIGTRYRVVLPPEVVQALGVHVGDPVFFVVHDDSVRLSRSPQTFGEFLQLHGEALPAAAELDGVDSQQLQFGWHDEE